MAWPAFGVDTPPISLCDQVQAPGIVLYRATDTVSWSPVSTSGVDVSAIGGSEWIVTGLPDAAGDERYQAVLTSALDATVRLASYSYGARPGERIVFRQAIKLPDSPITIKEGDTHGDLALEVLYGLPSDIGNPGTTVTASLLRLADASVIFADRAATISGVVQDAGSGTYGATLSYQVAPGDTDLPGDHVLEFTVCYDVDQCHTLPADDTLAVRIVPAFSP